MRSWPGGTNLSNKESEYVMAKRSLDDEYPIGNPLAHDCRWCKRRKVQQGSARLCPNCDDKDGEPITRSLLT